MSNLIATYTRWLHTRWPAGTVEKLPVVGVDGETSVSGLRIVGDLTGIPLLKFSVDTGARAVRALIAAGNLVPSSPAPTPTGDAGGDAADATGEDSLVDLIIVGAGVSGVAAAIEAKGQGLSYKLYEAAEVFSTVVNFPRAKPIFTYPTEMDPAGDLKVTAEIKEALLEELNRQKDQHGIEVTHAHVERVEKTGDGFAIHFSRGAKSERARSVILAIGRTGNYRKLGVRGESLDKVYNRLYDPKDHCGRDVLVVGGGDSALETTIALASCGANVTVSYRKPEFARPKPENIEKIRALEANPTTQVSVNPDNDRVTVATGPFVEPPKKAGSLRLMMASQVKEIRESEVVLTRADGSEESFPNDVVFAMIGREAPLDFFRRSGVRLLGERSPRDWALLSAFTLAIFIIYLWKSWWLGRPDLLAIGKDWGLGPETLLGAFTRSTAAPSFWFTLAYTSCIVGFGFARIRRRKTPYVKRQTLTLMAIQILPLFVLPEIVLPWMDANGWLPQVLVQNLFPNGEYWRSLGFVLAWPLFLVNLGSPQPMLWWIVIGLVQTFVFIPFIVWRWGKGAYCSWICSCGALAETMGDTHRQKMWHGPKANRWNMVGQVVLLLATLITLVFMLSWIPSLHDTLAPLSKYALKAYKFSIDVVIGGAIGVGFYFWFSGRVWCRIACPLAALMHIYARFSRFRIFANKKKCISCNVCTSVCHQGIDVMNFANKGIPMEDPECVRCSACVQSCPTGVLQFGRLDTNDEPIYDSLPASPVLIRERSEAGTLEV